MIVIVGILLNFITTFFADWYICRNVLARSVGTKCSCCIYLIVNTLVYLSVVLSMVLYKLSPALGREYIMAFFFWSVWVFIVLAAPKYTFVACSIVGDLISKKHSPKRLIYRRIALVMAVAVFGVMMWGSTIGRTSIEVKWQVIVSDKIPESFDGYRIVQFSDLHLEMLVGRDELLENMVNEINALDADLVINSGDIVNRSYEEIDSDILMRLSGIKSVDGVYSVLGNHDMGYYVADSLAMPREKNIRGLIDRLSQIGWNWLLDRSVILRRGADSVSLTGIIFPDSYRGNGHVYEMSDSDFSHAYDSACVGTYNITITHAPQLWDNILHLGYGDLSLAGHVHAMQFKIGNGKYAVSPARLFYKRWSGLYSEQGKHLYINDGIGYVMFPMRVGTRPELTLIELRHKR